MDSVVGLAWMAANTLRKMHTSGNENFSRARSTAYRSTPQRDCRLAASPGLCFFPMAWCVQDNLRRTGRTRALPSSPPRVHPADAYFFPEFLPRAFHIASVMLWRVLP